MPPSSLIIEFDPEAEKPDVFQKAQAAELERQKPVATDPAAESDAGMPTEESGLWEDDGPEPGATIKVPASDTENSYQFAELYSQLVRYSPEFKNWLLWTKSGWWWDRSGRIVERAKLYALEVEKSCTLIKDDDIRRKLTATAIKFAQKNRITDMLKLAQSDPRLVVMEEALDGDPWLAGVVNGFINLSTGEFFPPDPGVLITKRLGVHFDSASGCPLWEAFLDRILPDVSVRRYLQAWLGYSLTGLTQVHNFLFLFGHGQNGKSTFLETVRPLFGDYARTASENLIALHPDGSTAKAELSQLPGVRFLCGSETSQGVRLNEPLIKSLVGGDSISAEGKYVMPINFRPVAKMWLVGNYRPVITGTDAGIWRRVKLVPFTESISDEEKDEELPAKLRGELPGILNWMMAGLRDWRENGFVVPPVVAAATAEYRDDSDIVGSFLGEHVQTADGCRLTCKDVYSKYQEWCRDEGLRNPLSAKTFNKRLEDRGLAKGRSNGEKIWQGLAWLPENPALRLHDEAA